MCLLPTQTTLQFLSCKKSPRKWEWAVANIDLSLAMSLSSWVEAGGTCRCSTQAGVSLNQTNLWKLGDEKKKKVTKNLPLLLSTKISSNLWFSPRLQASVHSSWYLNEAPTTFCGNTVFCGSECKTQQQHHCKLWNVSENIKPQLRCQYSFKCNNVAS